jgi:hypothetical protein
MGRAKDIIVKVIPAKIANEFVKKHHYSGKVVNSQLHFGCFLDDKLHGVLQYGPPMKKLYMQKYIKEKSGNDVEWNGFIELNRMVFDDYLPKYSESRCISVTLKKIKTNAPHVKAVISFSDGTQCGDGTIYRASGFCLTDIKKNQSLQIDGDGVVYSNMSMTGKYIRKDFYEKFKSKGVKTCHSWQRNRDIAGTKPIEGFQLRYIYLMDKSCKITVPIIPFSQIDEMGAGMYRGEKVSLQERKAKHAAVAHKGEHLASSQKGAFDSTLPLNETAE